MVIRPPEMVRLELCHMASRRIEMSKQRRRPTVLKCHGNIVIVGVDYKFH